MSPEETKEHVQRRLSELGWNVHIGRTGYEKIFRATGGAETETNRICHELISVGAAGAGRDITDAVVDLAVTGPDRQEEQRPRARANGSQETDRASIDRLAAALEAKLREEGGRGRPQSFAGARLRPVGKGGGQPWSGAPGLPKALIVQSSREARARTAGALSRDFRIVEALDGEGAWAVLLEQSDIEVVVIDRALSETNGHSLTRRIRTASSPAHLSALPVVVIGGPDDANAGPAVLRAGASEFLPNDADARTLRARAVNLRKANGKPAGGPRSQAGERAARRSADMLIVEPRYPKASVRRSPRRFSSTMTITLSATILLALAIAATFYVSHNPDALGLRASGTAATAQPSIAPPPSDDRGPAAERNEPLSDTAREQAPQDERDSSAAMSAPPANNVVPRAEREAQDDSASRTPEAANQATAPTSRASEFDDGTPPRIARAQENTPRASSPDQSTPPPSASEAPAASKPPDAPTQESAPGDSTPSPESATGNLALRETLEREAPGVGTDSGAAGSAGPNNDGLAAERERAPENPSLREPPASTSPDPPANMGLAAPSGAAPSAAETVRKEPAPSAPTAEPPAAQRVERPEARNPADSSNTEPVVPSPEPAEQSAPARAERPAEGRDGGSSPEAQPAPAPRTEIAAARPPRAAASPTPSQPADQISRDELVSLVRRFASVYEAGDLNQFLSLFAENARTNDRAGREWIRKDYEALFRSTELRKMNLGELNWEVNGHQAYGWGEFDVTVRRRNDREEFAYTGSLTFVVEKVDGRLRIVRLFHGQQRVSS